MSGPSKPAIEPVESVGDLIAYLEAGCKPRDQFRIGTEHEKFVFRRQDFRRPTYDGADGIEALLRGFARTGYEIVEERGVIVALTRDSGANITYEPGGQIELSGAPLESIHDTCTEVDTHLKRARALGEELGVGLLGFGFDPLWTREDVPWMPKQRYELMREYMPKRGNLGLDMMTRTCTVQVNLDFESETDMIRKMRVSLALQPVATALYANSPFTEGRPNGYLSYRSHVWTDTDPDRCGTLPFVFEESMGFERYVEYVLDVPMYFVYRDGVYLDARGQSFRDFLAGKLPALPGEKPTIGDWADHLTTLFPEVRLKRYIEQRGADGGPWRRLCALPALWTGLLYDEESLAAAYDLVEPWSEAQRDAMRRDVPKLAFDAKLEDGSGRTVGDLAEEVLRLSRRGLARRAILDNSGRDETHFLDALDRIVERRETPAQQLLRLYESKWNGDLRRVYDEFAY